MNDRLLPWLLFVSTFLIGCHPKTVASVSAPPPSRIEASATTDTSSTSTESRAVSELVATPSLLTTTELQAALPVPEDRFFVDLTGTLDRDKATKQEIRQRLRKISKKTKGHLMLVLIERMADYPDLPQSLATFSGAVANAWAAQDSSTERGFVVVISLGDRSIGTAKTPNLPSSLSDKVLTAFRKDVIPKLDAGLATAMLLAAKILARTYVRHLEQTEPTLLL